VTISAVRVDVGSAPTIVVLASAKRDDTFDENTFYLLF